MGINFSGDCLGPKLFVHLVITTSELCVIEKEFISKSTEKFIKKYSKLISYHKDLNESETNWSHFTPINSDVSFVNASDELDIEAFKNWREEYKDAEFITEKDGVFKVGREVEKMSKSKYNVVSPDAICEEYGADSLRLFEMFLGPLEQSKPWKTSGISGVLSFLKKLWKLYHSGEDGAFYVSEDAATKDELKTLHKTIKKVDEDIANCSRSEERRVGKECRSRRSPYH